MKSKMVLIGLALLIVGALLVVAMVYQELIEEPEFPEDYHMQIPTGKYEWRSHNITITYTGVGLIVFALSLMIVGVWRR